MDNGNDLFLTEEHVPEMSENHIVKGEWAALALSSMLTIKSDLKQKSIFEI